MRKLSAVLILTIIYLPLAVATLTLTSIRPWILDRGFYERLVGDERLYEVALTEELPSRFSSDVFTTEEQLPVAALGIALREVVTPTYLREQALNIIDTTFDYIEGRVNSVQLSLDLTPIKAALAGEGRIPFASALAAALPSCAEGQSPIAPSGRLTRCLAVDTSVAAVSEQIAAALPAVLEDMPDHLVIDGQGSLRLNWNDYAVFLSSGVHTVLDISIVLLIFTTGAAACVGAYVGGDDLRGRLKWFSSALFAPASPFLLVGLSLTSPFIGSAISRSLATARWNGVQYSDALREAMLNLIVPVTQQIGVGFVIAGGIVCLMALVVLVWSWITPAEQKRVTRFVQVPAVTATPQ